MALQSLQNVINAIAAAALPVPVPVNAEGARATYSATATITPATAATDVLAILGSATKTVRVRTVSLTGNATAQGSLPVTLVKRSTAYSGGTSTAPTAVPHDSTDGAATAVLANYSANPTPGTLVGNVRGAVMNLPAAGTGTAPLTFDFGTRTGKTVVLRGTSQVLAINLGGGTIPAGASLTAYIEWTEE